MSLLSSYLWMCNEISVGKERKSEKVLVKRERKSSGLMLGAIRESPLLVNFSYSMPYIVLEMALVCNHGLYVLESSPHVPFAACIRCGFIHSLVY